MLVDPKLEFLFGESWLHGRVIAFRKLRARPERSARGKYGQTMTTSLSHPEKEVSKEMTRQDSLNAERES